MAAGKSERSAAAALGAILLLALLVRAAFAGLALARGTPADAVDTPSYVEPARSLLATGRFESADGEPELARTPGYPLLLALSEAVAGRARSIPATLAFQVILSTLTVWLVYVLALEFGLGRRHALLAASLYAGEPLSILFATKILTETLFTALFVATLVALARWARSVRPWWAALAGVLLAVACFVRPVLYYAPAVLTVALLALTWRARAGAARSLVLAGLFLAVAMTPLAAWRVRNAKVAGYDGFSAIADVNLLDYRAAGVVALRTDVPFLPLQAQWRRARGASPTGTHGADAARYRAIRREAAHILVRDPAAVAVGWVAGLGRTLFGPGTADWVALLGAERLWSRLAVTGALALFLFPVLFLARNGLAEVVGVASPATPGLDRRAAAPAVVASAYLLVLTAGPEAYSRFRQPLMPVVCVLAAAAVSTLRWRETH